MDYNDSKMADNDCRENDFLDDHKARFLIKIDEAKDGLELVREVENLRRENDLVKRNMSELRKSQTRKDFIMGEYIKRFGEHKEIPVDRFHRTFNSSDFDIEIPQTKEEKFFREVFRRLDSGNTVTLVIDITKDGYVIQSNNVQPTIYPIKTEDDK